MAYVIRTDKGFYSADGIQQNVEPTVFKSRLGASIIALALKQQGFISP